MIKIEITENGWVIIDVPNEDAVRMGVWPFKGYNDRIASAANDGAVARIAKAVIPLSDAASLERVSFTKKRGLSNLGWTATFINKDARLRFLQSRCDHDEWEGTGDGLHHECMACGLVTMIEPDYDEGDR